MVDVVKNQKVSKYRRCKGCIGGVTVEYAIIFPIVILCILFLIYIGIIYYEQSLIQAIVNENIQSCAFLWGYSWEDIDIKDGLKDVNTYTSKQLYQQIFSDSKKKKEEAIELIKEEIAKKSIIKPTEEMDVEIKYNNYLLYKKVDISVKLAYPLPFKGLLESIGLLGDISIQAHSEMIINDPKEFMQNIDYVCQAYDETGVKDWVTEQCKPLADSLKKIKGYFE